MASTGWLCPNVDYVNLENSYGNLHGFSAYWFGIFYCDDAARMLGYTDYNCASHFAADSSMNDVNTVVFSKTVTQYFNPLEFSE